MPKDKFGPYNVTVDFGIPRSERIRSLNCIWVGPWVNDAEFPPEGTDTRTLDLVFIRLREKRVGRAQARAIFREMEVTPRGIDWLVGAAAALVQLEYPVLALGEEDTNEVASIDGCGAKKMLTTFSASFTRFEHWFFLCSQSRS